jgi:hypothetical protein
MEREKFLALAESRYDELKALGSLDNFYDYEKNFDAIWQDLGRQYLEESLQAKQFISNDRRKKKR